MFHYQESCVLDHRVPEILSCSDSDLIVISSESLGEPDLRDESPAAQTSVSALGTSRPHSPLSVCLSSPHLPQPTLRESYEDEEMLNLFLIWLQPSSLQCRETRDWNPHDRIDEPEILYPSRQALECLCLFLLCLWRQWKQTRCPSTEERMTKLLSVHSVILLTVNIGNEIGKISEKGVELGRT